MAIRYFSLFFLCISLIFFGCKDSKPASEETYFGGTIQNRNSNFVVVKNHNSKLIDTFYLDKHNHFLHKFKNFQPGLYTFSDSREVQTVFIQKGDSLIFRLNTIEFDESLVYTGAGSKGNNYLVDMFLENEKQESLVLKYSQLDSRVFKKKIDSITNKKLKILEHFISKNKTSKAFNHIAKSNFVYQNYYNKEFYPFARYDKDEYEVLNNLDADFYDYRGDINYNDEAIKNYFPYRSFLRFHFNNLALANHFRHSKERTFNNTSLQYNIERLNQINKRVKLPYIKNDLSYYYMVRFLNNAKDVNDFETVFKTFSQVNTNEKSITNVSEIINAYTRLKPGLSLPDIIIIDKYDTEKKLRHLISKPTVMFFWSKLYKHHLNDAHSKASELSEKYPEIEFVAVNADNISSKNQAHILRQNQISYSNEFHFKNPENAKDLLAIRPINNVFLIDDEAKIVNPKANMFSVDFEHQLVELINQ
jgi:hypothetical protein